MVEHLICNEGVAGPNPARSTDTGSQKGDGLGIAPARGGSGGGSGVGAGFRSRRFMMRTVAPMRTTRPPSTYGAQVKSRSTSGTFRAATATGAATLVYTPLSSA